MYLDGKCIALNNSWAIWNVRKTKPDQYVKIELMILLMGPLYDINVKLCDNSTKKGNILFMLTRIKAWKMSWKSQKQKIEIEKNYPIRISFYLELFYGNQSNYTLGHE